MLMCKPTSLYFTLRSVIIKQWLLIVIYSWHPGGGKYRYPDDGLYGYVYLT